MGLARWARSRWKRLGTTAIVVLVVAANALAYMHARTFTRYSCGGQQTARPERLTHWQKLGVLFTGVTMPRPENGATPAAVGLTFTPHITPVADGTVETWHVPTTSPRGLVVMCHGRGSCKAAMLRETADFHDLGFDCLLVDFRGSGGSSGSACTLGIGEGEDVAAVVDSARTQWPGRRIILYGQSMGSAAILRAMAHHGVTADAVILECPFERLLTTVEHRFESMGVPTFPFARLLLFWGGVQNGFNAFAHNPGVDAAAVRCPGLVMNGGCDTWVLTSEAKAVCQAMSGPKRFEFFESAGHEPCIGANREQWVRVVRAFIDQHCP